MKIGALNIGPGHDPLIIAEVSGNHNGSLDRALAIVDAVADAGVQAIKLQTYTADTMTLPLSHGEFSVQDPDSLWAGRSLYELYEQAHTPWDWHQPIFTRARERGLLAFSSPFDATAVDFLESLDVPCYKIASFENVDLPLIARVARTGKPMIISTGLANLSEVGEAVACARDNGCKDLVLLKCTSSYPADPADSNLRAITSLAENFGTLVGLSDHTLGIGAAVASVALGACVIEKHVTLDREDGGVDSAFSLEPAEFAQLRQASAVAAQALGSPLLRRTANEERSLVFRRSLYICADLKAGEVLNASNLRAIRPGLGLPPKYLDKLLGRRVGRDVARGTPMDWNLLA